MKKAFIAFVTLNILATSAFAGTLYLKVSETSKITNGGIKRKDGLLSGRDIADHSPENIKTTRPMVTLMNTYVALGTSSYELRHIPASGREIFELTIKLLGNATTANAGLVYSAASNLPTGTTPTADAFNLTDTPTITIRSSNYGYIKDLVGALNTSTAAISCLIESGEIVTEVTGEAATEFMVVKSTSCHQNR